jgi:osmotically-inducible protein OsmY
MKTDAQIKEDVQDELAWDPSINANHIGVAVDRGVVTLTGHIDNYAEKFAVERAVQRVAGVLAFAMELDVKLAPEHKRSDTDIAEAARHGLQWRVGLQSEKIQVEVDRGVVTLRGKVEWNYQRTGAMDAVRHILGVVNVINMIEVKALPVSSHEVSSSIKAALHRHAEQEASRIQVSVDGSSVTLRGSVKSLSERYAASTAAWAGKGVTRVNNELVVA